MTASRGLEMRGSMLKRRLFTLRAMELCMILLFARIEGHGDVALSESSRFEVQGNLFVESAVTSHRDS